MFGLKKFYVSYYQDCGYGAVMICHGIIEAPDIKYAKENWEELWSGSHRYTAFQPIGSYNELIEVSSHLTNSQIIEKYGGK